MIASRRVGVRPVIWVAASDPGREHRAELRAHRIDAAHGHGAPADREVVRRQLATAHEVAPGGFVMAALPEPLPEPELRTRLLALRRGQRLERAGLVRGEARRLAAHPGPQRREVASSLEPRDVLE